MTETNTKIKYQELLPYEEIEHCFKIEDTKFKTNIRKSPLSFFFLSFIPGCLVLEFLYLFGTFSPYSILTIGVYLVIKSFFNFIIQKKLIPFIIDAKIKRIIAQDDFYVNQNMTVEDVWNKYDRNTFSTLQVESLDKIIPSLKYNTMFNKYSFYIFLLAIFFDVFC